jgi:hypothetical protein
MIDYSVTKQLRDELRPDGKAFDECNDVIFHLNNLMQSLKYEGDFGNNEITWAYGTLRGARYDVYYRRK